MLTPNSCPYCNSSNASNASICVTCGSSLINLVLETRDPISALPANTELGQGQFRILNEIARGGFGITYLAFHIAAKTYVAVKECFPDGIVTRDGLNVIANHGLNLEFQNTLERFNREAEILSKLEHPSATEILAHLTANNTAYIVMEYAKGETLEHRIARKKLLSSNEAIEILKPILELLAEVHDLGVLHRDIKPANIILTSERPELIDFGSVTQYNIGKSSKVTSRLLTPAYAPLEQYGQTVTLTPATDLYALGATFYEAITGITPPDAISRLNGVKLKPIEQLEPRIKPNLATIINRTLEMKLEDRFLSARHILQTLKDDFRYSNQSGVSRVNTQSNAAYSSFPAVPPAPLTPGLQAQQRLNSPNKLLPKFYPTEPNNPMYNESIVPMLIWIFTAIFITFGITIVRNKFGFYGLPLVILFFLIDIIYLSLKSKTFIPIEAVVIGNEILFDSKGDKSFSLKYVYTVKGVSFCASRNSFAYTMATHSMLIRHPLNSTMTVFYDPKYPEQAVIHRGFENGGTGTIIFRGFMLLCSIGLAFVDLPTKKY
jgi:serine/threonine protein kinase